MALSSWRGKSLWLAFALLLAAPLLFAQSAALSILSQCGCMMILALSFNMLLGQSGMLSFGHAVYSGLAAFASAHLMNELAGSSAAALLLVPLAGGVAGMLAGVVFGYVATRRSGTALSMISLALVELVAAAVLMLPAWFGGESGVSTNRVLGMPLFGVDFSSQLQVYYLIAFWLFVSTAAMYGLTQTPLGRIANAVRDNPQRAAFIGHDPRQVRYLMFMLSAFFAGVGGALTAINFEIVSAENLSLLRSAQILLFTFIGGIGYFFGPMIGAITGVLFSSLLSAYTRGWQLYLGLLFVLIVLFAPGGIAGAWIKLLAGWRQMTLRGWLRLAGGLLTAFGAVFLIEMLYRRAAIL
ncbi:branched-chain amino acid ABC transporter permease [Collimonas sp.]|jgi:branched-chain amino acid transport system permease protein|uniref:branched-chain amino acid ABC transporter permease n=1 Tax=Collimonas sp. TaxID=1963772 RepID=UPI002C1A20EE|nr:branched-chain amino acid ABC transporter permease [Collimonas sp.]HWX00585.1 branched-chain amino acid ABC transporter permease [Collimonas sp.]